MARVMGRGMAKVMATATATSMAIANCNGNGNGNSNCVGDCVVGQLYSVQYKVIFGMPNKARRYTCEEARPLRLEIQRDKVKIHHVIASMQDCWS
jgi:hypothetical protein